MTTFVTAVDVEDVVVRDTAVAAAVEEPSRAMILDMLADDAMSVGEIHDALERRGVERTENTVRHHVGELREAGLVDVARLEEGRGGIQKFYRANTVVLSYALPEGGDVVVDEAAAAVEPHLRAALEELAADHEDALAALESEMTACEHCETQKFRAYLLFTVLRRAFARAVDVSGDDHRTDDTALDDHRTDDTALDDHRTDD